MKAILYFLLLPVAIHASALTVDISSRQVNGYDRGPLRLLFSEQMIPLGFPIDSTPKGITLTPSMAGKWTWGSKSTLLFTPESYWQSGVIYTVTVPAGICSEISKNRLKKPYEKKFTSVSFDGRFAGSNDLRTTVGFVDVAFSLDVNIDSLKKHLSGAPKSLDILTSWRGFRLKPPSGWPGGKRITLSIDSGLTPQGGDVRLDSKLSTKFLVSDTLACLGLFRHGEKVSEQDTLFLEDDYELRFNRPLRTKDLPDYFTVSGKPEGLYASGDRISVNRFLKPRQPCTLSFQAGMPSEDDAFLFHDIRFILVGDLNRIDPMLDSFSIKGMKAHWGGRAKDSVGPVSLVNPVDLKPTLRFELLVEDSIDQNLNKLISHSRNRSSGFIFCFSKNGKDTFDGTFDSNLFLRPYRLPANVNCTLTVKAGYRLGNRQLKKDYTTVFRTGKIIFSNECKPQLNKSCDRDDGYENDDDYSENYFRPNARHNEPDEVYDDDLSNRGNKINNLNRPGIGEDALEGSEEDAAENEPAEIEENDGPDSLKNDIPYRSIINVFPQSPSVPIKRFGSPRVVVGTRSVGVKEIVSSKAFSRSRNQGWKFDTLADPAAGVNWYEYIPLPLTPVWSNRRTGIADVMLSVDRAPFDTLGRYQSTELGVQLMRSRLVTAVTVTSLIKMTPVAKVQISFIGKKGRVLARGLTDSTGLFRVRRLFNPQFVIAAFQRDTLVYKTKRQVNTQSFTELQYHGDIITDRDLYRTNDTIFFKGIVRRLKDRWEPMRPDTAIVTIQWNGAKQFFDTLPLTGCGSFSGFCVVPDDVYRQWYKIEATLVQAHKNIAGQFRVADFRALELSVKVGKSFIHGNSIHFPVSAQWLHGGATESKSFSWKSNSHRDYDKITSEHFVWQNRNRNYTQKQSSGSLYLDSSGCAVIDVPFLPEDSGAAFDFSITVNGSTIQSANATGTAAIPWGHRLCLGFSQPLDGSTNDTVLLRFLAMRENGDTGKSVTIKTEIVRHEIVRNTVKNRCGLPAFVRDTLHRKMGTYFPVTDTLGTADIQMVSMPEGWYTVTATPQGKDLKESFTYNFSIHKPDTGERQTLTDEPQIDRDEFTITEKDTGLHNVGDTVRVKISSNRDSCRVLLVVSRENLFEHTWIAMTSRDTVVPILIKDAFIPIVKVQASFLSPIKRNSRGLAIIHQDLISTQSFNLQVSDASRRVAVRVKTDKPSYSPGDSVVVRCTIPHKFRWAVALVMAVDEGELLRSSAALPGINETFSLDYVGVNRFKTECSFRNIRSPFDYDSLNALRQYPRHGVAGIGFGAGYGSGFGGGGGNVDDIIGGLLGGDGESALSLIGDGKGIRSAPRPCAYFNPKVTFDSSGTALCRFKLPGNLTRWRVTAVVDDTTCFGEDTATFTSSKPLMVRPQIPKFLRLGDSASGVYMVENRSDTVRIISTTVIMKSDTAMDKIKLSPNETRQCRVPLFAKKTGTDSLLFYVRADSLSDGIKISLPVICERSRDVAAIAGSTMDNITFPVMLPKPETIDSGNLSITLSATRMQNLREGMEFLFEYPYGCLEQQSSKIMPLLLLKDFSKRFDLPMLSKGDENKVIQKYLDHIADFQNDSSGGLRYWPERSDAPSPWLTAFVLEILTMAKKARYDVNDKVYSKALHYLLREMKNTDSTGKKMFIDSYTLLVSAVAGKADRPELRKLYKQEQLLPFSGSVNLLKAMYRAGGFKKQVIALQNKLLSGLIENDRLAYVTSEKAEGFEFCHESQVRLTALTLEALVETGSKSRFIEPMIRWLIEQRRFGRWRTTQENLAVFRAFSAYTKIYETETPKLYATIRLAGNDWFKATIEGRGGAFAEAAMPLDSISAKTKTEVTVSRRGLGRLYYDLFINTFPKGSGRPVNSGLIVRRTISGVEVSEKTPSERSKLRVGDLVKVELTIQCSQDITFAAINDPVPAGCEAINPDINGGEQKIAMDITQWSGPARLSHREFRDNRVLLFANNLPAGEYRFTYLLKPTTAGSFLWPGPYAEAMYFPEIYGRGAECTVTIEDK